MGSVGNKSLRNFLLATRIVTQLEAINQEVVVAIIYFLSKFEIRVSFR